MTIISNLKHKFFGVSGDKMSEMKNNKINCINDLLTPIPDFNPETEEIAVPIYSSANAYIVNKSELIRTPCEFFDNIEEANIFRYERDRLDVEQELKNAKETVKYLTEILENSK